MRDFRNLALNKPNQHTLSNSLLVGSELARGLRHVRERGVAAHQLVAQAYHLLEPGHDISLEDYT